MPTQLTKDELFDLYWMKGLSPEAIQYHLQFPDVKAVEDLLNKFRIPAKRSAVAKRDYDLTKQYQSQSKFLHEDLTSNTDEIISEAIEIRQYSSFQFFIAFAKKGTLDGDYVRVIVQFSDSLSSSEWFDYIDGLFYQIYFSENQMPLKRVFTGSCFGTRYIRVKVIAYGADLSSSNTFYVDRARISLT